MALLSKHSGNGEISFICKALFQGWFVHVKNDGLWQLLCDICKETDFSRLMALQRVSSLHMRVYILIPNESLQYIIIVK